MCAPEDFQVKPNTRNIINFTDHTSMCTCTCATYARGGSGEPYAQGPLSNPVCLHELTVSQTFSGTRDMHRQENNRLGLAPCSWSHRQQRNNSPTQMVPQTTEEQQPHAVGPTDNRRTTAPRKWSHRQQRNNSPMQLVPQTKATKQTIGVSFSNAELPSAPPRPSPHPSKQDAWT